MNAATIARAALGVGLALTLALGPGAALAEGANDTPATAIVLSGTVAGDVEAAPPTLGSGRQAYLRLEYPGDGSTVTVEVDITPGDLVSASHAGFKVYGPTNGRLYAEGGQTGKHPSHAAEFSATEAGTYLVEVFNYNVTPIHFEASASGLPPQPAVVATPTVSQAPAAAPPATPTPVPVGQNTTADRAAELVGPVSATLGGNPSGSYHYYRLPYAGDGSSLRIDLDVSPSDQQTAQRSGFVVYGPKGGQEITRGGYQGRSPTHSTTLVTNEPGTYLVQVFNYGSTPIQYQLDVSGRPAQPAAPPAQEAPQAPAATGSSAAPSAVPVGLNVSADRPADLVAGTVSAVLLSGQSGSSHFYRVAYPGDGSTYRVDLNVSPSDPETSRASGFVVHGPTAGREYARGTDREGSPTHSADLASNEPGSYLIEVFNASPRAIGYRLTLTPAA